MNKINFPGNKLNFIIFAIIFLFFIININTFAQEEVINKNCELNWDIFNRDWKKYSDIDERFSFDELELSARSWETQQYYTSKEKIIDLKLQIYFLKRDMEIDRQMRLELRDYKHRLVHNIKVNLLKSFWRMAYITYDTIKTAKGVGRSYAKAITSAEVIPKIGSSLKVLQGLKPKKPLSEKNQNDITSKIKSVSVKGALEAIESLADPAATGKAVFDETVKQILPSADLTKEEIALLKEQHEDNNLLTAILEESYRFNQERRKQVQQLEEQVKQLEEEHLRWEAEEKQRVADMLVDSCKKNLQKAARKDEPVEEEVIQYGETECPPPPEGFKVVSVGEGGVVLNFDATILFSIEPESTCAYHWRKFAPGFPYFIWNMIESVLFVWQFPSVDEAKKEFADLIFRGKSEMGSEVQIVDDTENRFIVKQIERMEETASDGTVEGDWEPYTYERSMSGYYGFVLYKRYILLIRNAIDVPATVEANAMKTAESAFLELEENIKLLLADRR